MARRAARRACCAVAGKRSARASQHGSLRSSRHGDLNETPGVVLSRPTGAGFSISRGAVV
eukprot:6193522-Pleurochrysis_carterae.AAC.1